MQLYKFLHSEHAKAMLLHGQVRIGTLQEYRDREDALRGDPDEGTLQESLYSGPEPTALDRLPPFASRAFGAIVEGVNPGRVRVINSTFVNQEVQRHCYVFCASTECSSRAAGDYDACVAIRSHDRFCRLVTKGIVDHLGIHGTEVSIMWDPVTYDSREEEYPRKRRIDLAYLKDPRFSLEREFRFTWRWPGQSVLKLLILRFPSLRSMLRAVDIPSPMRVHPTA